MENAGRHDDDLRITCPRCGTYELIGRATISDSYRWDSELRNGLSCAARQAHETEQMLKVTSENAAELAAPHMQTRVSDNFERFLNAIAKRAIRPDNAASFNLNDDFPIIDCTAGKSLNGTSPGPSNRNWLYRRVQERTLSNLCFQWTAGIRCSRFLAQEAFRAAASWPCGSQMKRRVLTNRVSSQP
jgi:hypothetical protein